MNGDLDSTGEYGINGGFFNPEGDIEKGFGTLNIAVKNSVPVIRKDYNGGMGNYMSEDGEGCGTIVYTGSSMRYVKIKEAWEINNYVKSYIWAHGGVSMKLGNNSWEEVSKKEGYRYYLDRADYRSSIVADYECNVYLIVTNTKVQPKQFREAIQRYFNINDGTSTDKIGLFLDGSTCAQLKCKDSTGREVLIKTDYRKLMTIIILENKN